MRVRKLYDQQEYLRSVVISQCILYGEQNGTRRIPCPDFTSICYNGGPCSLCAGRGWILTSYKA